MFSPTNYFIKNSAEGSGGAIAIFVNVALTFNGTNNFISNSANSDGGAIYAVTNSLLTFNGTTDFSNNSAKGECGGAICGKITVSLHSLELVILAIIQPSLVVVQFTHMTMLSLLSVIPTASPTTQLMVTVVQSM